MPEDKQNMNTLYITNDCIHVCSQVRVTDASLAITTPIGEIYQDNNDRMNLFFLTAFLHTEKPHSLKSSPEPPRVSARICSI